MSNHWMDLSWGLCLVLGHTAPKICGPCSSCHIPTLALFFLSLGRNPNLIESLFISLSERAELSCPLTSFCHKPTGIGSFLCSYCKDLQELSSWHWSKQLLSSSLTCVYRTNQSLINFSRHLYQASCLHQIRSSGIQWVFLGYQLFQTWEDRNLRCQDEQNTNWFFT